jgi:hypothetical protein
MTTANEIVVGEFDFITCLGNSLSLLPSIEGLEKTISSAYSLLVDNGVFVAQTLNFTEIRKSGFRFFPLKGGYTKEGTEVIFVRFFEPFENTDKATLVLASFRKQDGEWIPHISKQQVIQLDRTALEKAFRKAGFSQIGFYAGYTREPFLPEASRNIVVVANR